MTTAILQPDHDALLNRGFAALQTAYRMPDVAPAIDEARAWCKQLVLSRHKNFPAAAWSLPKPALSKRAKLALAFHAIGSKYLPFLRLGPRATGKAA
jgi:hypothetical protein